MQYHGDPFDPPLLNCCYGLNEQPCKQAPLKSWKWDFMADTRDRGAATQYASMRLSFFLGRETPMHYGRKKERGARLGLSPRENKCTVG